MRKLYLSASSLLRDDQDDEQRESAAKDIPVTRNQRAVQRAQKAQYLRLVEEQKAWRSGGDAECLAEILHNFKAAGNSLAIVANCNYARSLPARCMDELEPTLGYKHCLEPEIFRDSHAEVTVLKALAKSGVSTTRLELGREYGVGSGVPLYLFRHAWQDLESANLSKLDLTISPTFSADRKRRTEQERKDDVGAFMLALVLAPNIRLFGLTTDNDDL